MMEARIRAQLYSIPRTAFPQWKRRTLMIGEGNTTNPQAAFWRSIHRVMRHLTGLCPVSYKNVRGHLIPRWDEETPRRWHRPPSIAKLRDIQIRLVPMAPVKVVFNYQPSSLGRKKAEKSLVLVTSVSRLQPARKDVQ